MFIKKIYSSSWIGWQLLSKLLDPRWVFSKLWRWGKRYFVISVMILAVFPPTAFIFTSDSCLVRWRFLFFRGLFSSDLKSSVDTQSTPEIFSEFYYNTSIKMSLLFSFLLPRVSRCQFHTNILIGCFLRCFMILVDGKVCKRTNVDSPQRVRLPNMWVNIQAQMITDEWIRTLKIWCVKV